MWREVYALLGSSYSIEPHGIALPSQLQRQLFFHLQRFSPSLHGFDVIVKAGAQVASILLHDVGRKFVSFLVAVAGSMLHKAFLRSFAGHTHVEAFQHAMKLGVGFPKFRTFSKYLFG